jgi:hypothetical protein
MTSQEGRGVQVLSQLVKRLVRLNPVEASMIVDGLLDDEVASVLQVCSAARVAQEGEIARDVFDESVARRLATEAEVTA